MGFKDWFKGKKSEQKEQQTEQVKKEEVEQTETPKDRVEGFEESQPKD